ncbi:MULTISPECIES: isochorismatase family cysteine hydrolase [Pseudovibrio]|uniref:isochorismatase family cysteine hydrolase n=1 Tax=Stappiaceae TaxID=2821832 RepID=UPI0023657548|nr:MULTISPECIES: isochorismatase family cysteine hydrolase [Pseudovibrio]MDD7911419.1 cysteine hydrolase [Pseudovibrio exalbescens]MDX5592894.1 isochorismatase family cysteine hydrolase [Pseudovibrio sp. SPO723]
MIIGIVVALTAIAALLIYTIRGLHNLRKPTNGMPITLAARPNTALVLVDLQEDFLRAVSEDRPFSEEINRASAEIRRLTSYARAQGWPVIIIRHIYKGWYTNKVVHMVDDGRGAADSDGLGLDPRFNVQGDAEFIKHRSDAFSSHAFNDYLEDRKIGTLVLAGLDGNLCVKNTAQGGLNRGYRILFSEDAVISRDTNKWWETRRTYGEKGVKPFKLPVPEPA